jgi:hypothetical protein
MTGVTSDPAFSADDPLYGEDPFYERDWLDRLDPADGEAVDYLLSECPHGVRLLYGCSRCQQQAHLTHTKRRPA